MRGSFLRSLEESCRVQRETVQRQANEPAFEVVESAQRIIILNATARSTANVGEIIELDNKYTGNIRPPNYNISVGDQVVRSSEQILTVTKITVIRDVQRLDLEDRDSVVA